MFRSKKDLALIEKLQKELEKLKGNDDVTRLNTRILELHKQIADLQGARTVIEKEFNEQKALAYKTMELEFKGRQMDEIQKIRAEYDKKIMEMNTENYDKLKTALAKLHEEGNAQTKFTEQIALKMMDTMNTKGVKVIENTNGKS